MLLDAVAYHGGPLPIPVENNMTDPGIITAEDVNTTIHDLEIVRRSTRYVTGLSEADGGSGNPSPYTAYGVFLGLCAALGWHFGTDDPKGKTVWERKNLSSPSDADRLPNGNTIVAENGMVREFDKTGKQVRKIKTTWAVEVNRY